MIVWVDLDREPPAVELRPDQGVDEVAVHVNGPSLRSELNRALTDAGAGCVPGHFAELRIDWLVSELSSHRGHADGPPLWERLRAADEDGHWVAAPIRWDAGVPPD